MYGRNSTSSGTCTNSSTHVLSQNSTSFSTCTKFINSIFLHAFTCIEHTVTQSHTYTCMYMYRTHSPIPVHVYTFSYLYCTCKCIEHNLKPNIHDTIWSHTIYKSQRVYYKIIWSYVTYDMSYKIELLSIPYDATQLNRMRPNRNVYIELYTCTLVHTVPYLYTQSHTCTQLL